MRKLSGLVVFCIFGETDLEIKLLIVKRCASKCLGGLCRPFTPNAWIYTDEKSLIGGAPRLAMESGLFCMHSGVIRFSDNKLYGPIDFYVGMNNNKIVAGVIDTTSGALDMIASGAMIAGSEFTFGVSGGVGAYEAAKSLSDFINDLVNELGNMNR